MVSSEHTTFTGWFKSSYSSGGQGDCLEVARGYAGVPVRDSKAVTAPALMFSTNRWAAFVDAVKDNRI